MSEKISDDHPLINLLFCVDCAMDEIDDKMRAKIERLVERMAGSRDWVLAPPEFVDVVEDDSCTEPDDLPIVTLGGILQLYSAFPPHEVPREIDLAQLHEVESLIAQLLEFAREQQIDFEFEFNGESIGEIVDGELDHSMEKGLLGEWRKHLDE